ncbi:MAG: restriction endonuclease [Potamolinea sp.]
MIDPKAIQKQVKIILPKDWDKDTNKKGEFLENLVAYLLSKRGFRVNKRVNFTGMEVDVIAKNKETQQEAFVECKFTKNPLSADVIWKLIGKTWHHDISYAYLFSTALLGKDAQGALEEIKKKQLEQSDRKPILAFVGPEEMADWFIDVKSLEIPDLNKFALVKVITLLITPTQFIWAAEEIREGDTEPSRLIIFPTSENCSLDFKQLCNDLGSYELWENLERVDGTTSKLPVQAPSVSALEKEVVSPIGRADNFEDYRPCRPEYFVGRSHLQQEFWKLLANIRDGKTQTRIVCFTGPSGFGKSSLVVKLTEDCRHHEMRKDNFYLFDVDVRSAKGAFFVKKAVMSAIQKAIDENFIELPEHKISIESTEQSFFYSQSIQQAIKKLKSTKRFIVIFFDQFETILTKESLLGVYHAFEEVATEINALKENIILGFCWRTDVSTSMRHPAYKFWHQLSDHRKEFELKEFTEQESHDFIKQFKKEQGQILKKHEENFIHDRCPGFPWLYKMICVDIYENKITGNPAINQDSIDTKKMFNKVMNRYANTPEQQECLKYIAKNSRVEMNEVRKKYGDDVIEWLASNRLVIQSGSNYVISWDIFRDLLNGKEEPLVDFLIYLPKNPINTVINVFTIIIDQGSKWISIPDLTQRSTYQQATLKNIIRDLYNFDLVIRENNKVIAQEKLINLQPIEIADYLANKLKKHTIIKTVYDQVHPGGYMTLENFQKVVASAPYTKESLVPKTPNDNASRIISWFCFAGLLEYRDQWWIFRPKGDGKDKGKLKEETGQLSLFNS